MAGSWLYAMTELGPALDGVGAGDATCGRTPGLGLGDGRARGEPGDLYCPLGELADGGDSSCMMALMASFWMTGGGVDDCLCERKGEAKRSGDEARLDGDFSVEGRRPPAAAAAAAAAAGEGEPAGDEWLEAEVKVDVLLNALTMTCSGDGEVDCAGAVACSGGR